jgi:acyl-CoA dehydrogenase
MVVERGMEGFERGRNLDKMGLKAQDTAELFFNNVKIPKENVLGEPGKGFYYLMEGLAEERLINCVGCITSARKAFNVTRDFVMERKAFGQSVADFQNTQFKMAEMDTEIDMVQTYTDHCVEMHNAGKLTGNMGAKLKIMGAETEWKMMDLGVQLHGGAGYMREYEICRMFTDARISRIYAGTTEIMKTIVGKDIFSDSYTSILD